MHFPQSYSLNYKVRKNKSKCSSYLICFDFFFPFHYHMVGALWTTAETVGKRCQKSLRGSAFNSFHNRILSLNQLK